MQFRTPINPFTVKHPFLSHNSNIVTIGSCFAENIGDNLQQSLYNVNINPLGPLYNPLSILNGLKLATGERITEADLFQDVQGIWHSFDFHSRFSNVDNQKALQQMNDALSCLKEFLKEPELIVTVTLGSSRCFMLKENSKIVSNCHKRNASEFIVKDLDIPEIIEALLNIVGIIRKYNKESKIIFTVSPVRHLSYGMHVDKLSKAKLLIAIDAVLDKLSELYYFPAYEIMVDDLRDYRFYTSDMLHPNETACAYIFDNFISMFGIINEKDFSKRCNKLYKRLNHKENLCVNSEFNEQTNRIIKELGAVSPNIFKSLNRISNNEKIHC